MSNDSKPSAIIEDDFCQESSFKSYENSRKACKCGCIASKKAGVVIPNDVWMMNQKKIHVTRQLYSDDEKDMVMRNSLYQKLKESKFEFENSHVKLQFTELLDVPYGCPEIFTLCESCYVHFHNHKCT